MLFFSGLLAGDHDPIRGLSQEVGKTSRLVLGDSPKSHGTGAVGSAVFHGSLVGSGHSDARVATQPVKGHGYFLHHL